MRDVIIISLPRTIAAPSSSEVGELNSLLALVVIFPAAGLGWRAQGPANVYSRRGSGADSDPPSPPVWANHNRRLDKLDSLALIVVICLSAVKNDKSRQI